MIPAGVWSFLCSSVFGSQKYSKRLEPCQCEEFDGHSGGFREAYEWDGLSAFTGHKRRNRTRAGEVGGQRESQMPA